MKEKLAAATITFSLIANSLFIGAAGHMPNNTAESESCEKASQTFSSQLVKETSSQTLSQPAENSEIPHSGLTLDEPEVLEEYDSLEVSPGESDDEESETGEDFLQNIVIVWETADGTVLSSAPADSIQQSQLGQTALTVSEYLAVTNSSDLPITQTGPTIYEEASLDFDNSGNVSIRFRSSVLKEQRNASVEYGFLVARTAVLEQNNAELTFDLASSLYISSAAYRPSEGIDIISSQDETSVYFTALLTGLTPTNYVSYLTVRPYIIYSIDGDNVVVYGDAYSDSIYRTAKRISEAGGEDFTEEVANIIDLADSFVDYDNAYYWQNFEQPVQRAVSSDPDVDVLLVAPMTSGYYTFSCTGDCEFELALINEADQTNFIGTNIDGETVYLLEKYKGYYIIVRGEQNSEYCITANSVIPEAVIWDFSMNSEGFFFGHDASAGSASLSNLVVSINKSESSANFSQKAYTKKNSVNLDILDFSKVIVRLKNTTDAASIQGYFELDKDYEGDGESEWYQPSLLMPANMTEYEDIVFDLTLQYGMLKSFMLGFGEGGQVLSGEIYIDSISFIPMPETLSWDFNTDNDNEGWTSNDRVGVKEVSDGIFTVQMLGKENWTDGAIYSPDNSGVSTELYDKLQIRLKNNTAATQIDVYYTTYNEGHDTFNAGRCMQSEITAYGDDFVEYTFDMKSELSWNGIFKRFMIALPDAEGTVEIDYIRLSKFDMEYQDVVWDFEDNTLEGFTTSTNGASSSQHYLSVDNGILEIERVSSGNGGVFTPKNLKLLTEEYRYLVLGVKSASTTSEFRVYFDTSDTDYKENDDENKIAYTASVSIEESNVFKEYVIDLAAVPDGWTSAYTGVLDNLMFSLRNSGSFEFDYIKLSTSNQQQSVSESEILIDVEEGRTHLVLISTSEVVLDAESIYTITYDDSLLSLEDACAFTFEKELQQGEIGEAGITIISVEPGKLRFKTIGSDNKYITGPINSLRFSGIDSGETFVSISIE